MAEIVFKNFAYGQLATSVSPTTTTLVLESGQGARFPSITGDNFYYITLENVDLVREIVKVTGRTNDTLTVVRGQDNTTAQSWAAGDVVAQRLNAATIEYMINEVVRRTSATGSAQLPSGPQSARDETPAGGYMRFNTDNNKFEGYNGTNWASVGGGATGGGADEVFIENNNVVTEAYTLPANRNAMSVGPLTINANVTVPDGARWVIL